MGYFKTRHFITIVPLMVGVVVLVRMLLDYSMQDILSKGESARSIPPPSPR